MKLNLEQGQMSALIIGGQAYSGPAILDLRSSLLHQAWVH